MEPIPNIDSFRIEAFVATAQDTDGNTPAMDWVITIKTNPPRYMRHDNKMTNNAGKTIAMLWKEYVGINKPLPEWMK
jgi:hypothetical protein